MYLSDLCRFLLCSCGWERRVERRGERRGERGPGVGVGLEGGG